MNESILQQVRTDVATLLNQATDSLDAKALYLLVQDKIHALREARTAAHGGGGTFTLNGLLAAEHKLRTKVFGVPPEPIRADF